MSSKAVEGFPFQSKLKRVGKEEGAEQMRAFASKQDKLCPESQTSLGLDYPSRKNVNCHILCLYFQSYLTVKNYQEWEYQAERSVLSQKYGSPCYTAEAFEGKFVAFPRITAFSRLPCLEAVTLVLLQANPHCRVSPHKIWISRDSQE